MCFSTNCSRVWGKIVPVITREQHVYISSFLAKKDYTNKKEKRETVSARRVSPGHVFHAFVFLTRWAHFQNVSLLKIGKKKNLLTRRNARVIYRALLSTCHAHCPINWRVVAVICVGDMQPWFIAYTFGTEHPCSCQLTPAKTRYIEIKFAQISHCLVTKRKQRQVVGRIY